MSGTGRKREERGTSPAEVLGQNGPDDEGPTAGSVFHDPTRTIPGKFGSLEHRHGLKRTYSMPPPMMLRILGFVKCRGIDRGNEHGPGRETAEVLGDAGPCRQGAVLVALMLSPRVYSEAPLSDEWRSLPLV